MSFDPYYDGHCPECRLLRGNDEEMWLNRGDFFECPNCHLMVSLREPTMTAILRRRGNGNFRDQTNPENGSLAEDFSIRFGRLHGENLQPHIWPDPAHPLKDIASFRHYLTEIFGVDPLV
ncbi:MAG: hypothetical protein ACOYMW_00335 [Candidatus Competibacteraceae bacterium]|jgi:hypothetical protein